MVEQIPVLNLGPILLVSIQAELHDRAAEELQMSILGRLEKTGAEALLIDITALEFVDSFISRIICETVEMTRLMNTRTVLVGMRPAVTITLLEMGMDMSMIESAMDIEAGLEKLGYRLISIKKKTKRKPNAL